MNLGQMSDIQTYAQHERVEMPTRSTNSLTCAVSMYGSLLGDWRYSIEHTKVREDVGGCSVIVSRT